MKKRTGELPDLALLRGVVAPEILRAAETASRKLDRYLEEHAPGRLRRWARVKEIAAREE